MHLDVTPKVSSRLVQHLADNLLAVRVSREVVGRPQCSSAAARLLAASGVWGYLALIPPAEKCSRERIDLGMMIAPPALRMGHKSPVAGMLFGPSLSQDVCVAVMLLECALKTR